MNHWQQHLFRLLIAVAVIYALAIALFVLESNFVPKQFAEFIGSIVFGAGALYFSGIPGLLIMAFVHSWVDTGSMTVYRQVTG